MSLLKTEHKYVVHTFNPGLYDERKSRLILFLIFFVNFINIKHDSNINRLRLSK